MSDSSGDPLRSIRALLAVEQAEARAFVIPSYQRGYRWTKIEVTQLLEDLAEFQAAESATFYCLQPLVVRNASAENRSEVWEVIDGQQRLTTLFLILTCLKEKFPSAFAEVALFSLRYETRQESGEFLAGISSRKDGKANIDFHHMFAAYETIRNWFDLKPPAVTQAFIKFLLTPGLTGNAQFIWHELTDEGKEAAVRAFIRLNVGKIPLTEAELIRALFLRSRANLKGTEFTRLQERISQEWDEMEKALQANEFWYFLQNGDNPPANRIEVLLKWAATAAIASHKEQHWLFQYYQETLRDPSQQANEWEKVRTCFMQLREWHQDRELYHLIGFLIHNGESMVGIRALAAAGKKSAFPKALLKKIRQKIGGSEEIQSWVEGLEYGKDDSAIRRVLLLYNIAVLMGNCHSTLRLPFHSYKTQQWDIEHVRSVTSGQPNAVEDCKNWLAQVAEYLQEEKSDDDLLRAIEVLIRQDPFNHDEFGRLFSKIQDEVEGTGESDANEIGNLVLLDANTNRSYKNAIFPVKRRRVLELDRGEIFVPLCTRDVFLRRTSTKLDGLPHWTDDDMTDYTGHIVSTLKSFFEPSL